MGSSTFFLYFSQMVVSSMGPGTWLGRAMLQLPWMMPGLSLVLSKCLLMALAKPSPVLSVQKAAVSFGFNFLKSHAVSSQDRKPEV